MTITQDRYFQTGLAGSFVIHALLLLFFTWFLNSEAGRRLLEPPEPPAPVEEQKEVTMIFPEMVIPPALQPKPKAYIRTTQNQAATAKPAGAAFESDRNTIAASKLPPKADATLMMPTTNGDAPTKMELANRDFRDGQIKNDAVAATPPNATPLDMRPPAPSAPPSILKPQPVTPPPPQVAKATPADTTPLAKMMQEMDQESARLDINRLPLEVRKPEAKKSEETPPPKPQVRAPSDESPPVPKAIPVADDVKATAGMPEKEAFSPFTRMGKNDGAISREGDDAVDAVATPRGIYMRQVTGAVEKKWHLYVRLARDSVTFGRVRFRFYVDQRGTPQDLKILSDARDADPRMREITLRAILDADIPPIPDDLIPELEDGRLKIEYEAIVY